MSLSKSGIYKIRNVINGRIYIGSAVNLVVRIRHHKARLRAGDHRNVKLQRSFDKYGMDAFTFDVIERVDDVSKLIEREQFWIDSTKCAVNGFNIAIVAGSTLGAKRFGKALENTIAANKKRIGHKLSEEHRKKLSEVSKGRKKSKEHIEKLVKSRHEKWMSPEMRVKMIAVHLGAKRSDETRMRMSEAAKNKPPMTAEHRAKLGAASRRWQQERRLKKLGMVDGDKEKNAN